MKVSRHFLKMPWKMLIRKPLQHSVDIFRHTTILQDVKYSSHNPRLSEVSRLGSPSFAIRGERNFFLGALALVQSVSDAGHQACEFVSRRSRAIPRNDTPPEEPLFGSSLTSYSSLNHSSIRRRAMVNNACQMSGLIPSISSPTSIFSAAQTSCANARNDASSAVIW